MLPGQASFIPEFAQMCGKLMGRFWEYLGSFFSLLAVTGAAVVYWVLMSNFLYNTVTYIYGKQLLGLQNRIKLKLHKCTSLYFRRWFNPYIKTFLPTKFKIAVLFKF